jgi:hypothetical protein
MYGSCATELDLPSSDLDLVVCGLDDINMMHIPMDNSIPNSPSNSGPNLMQSPSNSSHSLQQSSPAVSDHSSQYLSPGHNLQYQSPANSAHNLQQQSPEISEHNVLPSPTNSAHGSEQPSLEELEVGHEGEASPGHPDDSPSEQIDAEDMMYDESGMDVNMMGMEQYSPDYHVNQQEFYYVPYNYVSPMALNAQRVLRLAHELEMQPWAVQVKAIPTATVPVVKMLADPSRLPGVAGSGGNWMEQHIAAQAGVPPADQMKPSHFFPPHSMPTWRGADIMNGLQPIDITFEGPEHGGIGSTTYSACVVQDACKETNLPPESTPVVQVAMVLKELLAQRRLNEPFSGGLSSYALLLLLLAVLKDRRILQEEMERVEKQRQAVSRLDNKESKMQQKQLDPINEPQTNKTTPTLSAAQIVAGKGGSSKSKKNRKAASPGADSSNDSGGLTETKSSTQSTVSKPTASSSWASIAKKSNGSTARTDSISTATKSTNSSAVAPKTKPGTEGKQPQQKEKAKTAKSASTSDTNAKNASQQTASDIKNDGKHPVTAQSSKPIENHTHVTPSEGDDNKLGAPFVPQGSNDVFEVLCSGELTSGKLLMHFLLFYGQHFDAQTTLIDLIGTHHPEYGRTEMDKLSPFVTRPPGGTIDPITGMFSVDPIVVYDPLEGAMDHNVSKRCYCWNNVRWVFAQCYMTVSSVVETSGTCTKSTKATTTKEDGNAKAEKSADIIVPEQAGSNSDIVTPILELLLSF